MLYLTIIYITIFIIYNVVKNNFYLFYIYTMKKFWLLTTLLLGSLLLAGCGSNCPTPGDSAETETPNEYVALAEATQYCFDNGWVEHTYTVEKNGATYWMCQFPHGMGCDDEAFRSWECYEQPGDISDYDTPQERATACRERMIEWIKEMEELDETTEVNIELEPDETQNWENIVLNWTAKFEKDWEKNYDFTCQVDMFYGWTTLEIANPEDEEY